MAGHMLVIGIAPILHMMQTYGINALPQLKRLLKLGAMLKTKKVKYPTDDIALRYAASRCVA